MFEPLLILIAAAFLFAGFVKGVIGLGLPTVAMGLLAVTMPPAQAIAIVIVPAIVTNIWQTFVGPYLADIIRRLWPLMAGTVIGIWLNAGMLTGPYARYGTIVLGALLVIYAIVGLSRFSFKVARKHEKWVGGIVGLITGLVSDRDDFSRALSGGKYDCEASITLRCLSLKQRRARHEGVECGPELRAITVLLLQDFVLRSGDHQMRTGAEVIGEFLDCRRRHHRVVTGRQHQDGLSYPGGIVGCTEAVHCPERRIRPG